MIKGYVTAIKVAFVGVLGAVIAYYRAVSKRREAELKDVELGSAKTQIQAQADAEAADQEALKRGHRRSTDAINNAKSGDRSYFE